MLFIKVTEIMGL